LGSRDRFKALFFEEAQQLLGELEGGLLELEARQSEREHLDRTFRAAHTLKGSAGMVGLRAIADFTHRVEAVLERIRSGELPVTKVAVNTLLEARDYLVGAIEAEASGGMSAAAPADLLARLGGLERGESVGSGKPPTTVQGAPAADSDPRTSGSQEGVRLFRFRPDIASFEVGDDPLGVLVELRELGATRIEAELDRVPELEALDPLQCLVSWRVEIPAYVDASRLEEALLFAGTEAFVELSEERGQFPQAAAEPVAKPVAARALPQASTTAGPTRVRVDAQLLDRLIGLAGELAVLADGLQSLLGQPWAERWANSIEGLDQVGRQLRDAALELRMVPIEDLFARLPRMVRDAADQAGKQVSLFLEGEETHIDRAMTDRLFEPLVHLIRNAVDHGIEPAADRERARKPAVGQIRVSAGHEGDRVTLRLEDDGRGLDRERIREKAVARGLLPAEIDVADPRVVGVIFEPGFSTKEEAGELSGRGVGLDVVRDSLRGLRGTVGVETTPGKGTAFVIRLPLTLAMVDGLLVEVSGGRFVVPLAQVEECVAEGAGTAESGPGPSTAVVRGELVPVIAIGPPRSRTDGAYEGARPELLLTRHAGRRVAVAVDRLLGRVQTVVQPLAEELASLGMCSGATILSDGGVALVLDLMTIVAEAGRKRSDALTG
jgi:two-component system chemotaxis sensor kinase CheA